MKKVELFNMMIKCLLLQVAPIVFISSCILSPEDYDSSVDNGTYSGEAIVYDGPGTDPDFIDRTCPEIDITLVVQNEDVVLTLKDNYPDYGHHPDVVTNHVVSAEVFANNKFRVSDSWNIERTDVQLVDLMNLEFCESTPPSFPGDPTTGSQGGIISFGLEVDEPGFIGEFGSGIARGSLFYGVRCTDDRFIPLCLYFMQLSK